MNRFGLFLRNLLLFALVGWAGVDDYFPTVGTAGDFGGENGDCVLFEGAGCRRGGMVEDLAPSASRSVAMNDSLAVPAVRAAARNADPGMASTNHLYALMSLRR